PPGRDGRNRGRGTRDGLVASDVQKGTGPTRSPPHALVERSVLARSVLLQRGRFQGPRPRGAGRPGGGAAVLRGRGHRGGTHRDRARGAAVGASRSRPDPCSRMSPLERYRPWRRTPYQGVNVEGAKNQGEYTTTERGEKGARPRGSFPHRGRPPRAVLASERGRLAPGRGVPPAGLRRPMGTCPQA